MYVSPNHPNPPKPYVPSAPPEETGRRLATFPRGPDAELRVSLDTYKGSDFVSVRVWERGSLDRPTD
jgi:hypothetical protein